MSKKNEEYLDVVLLIRRTTKIESTLEALGGDGGGIWEKADSISSLLPNDFMQKIIKIGKIRNDAIHGDLKVKNIDFAVKECDGVIAILEGKQKLEELKKDLKSKFNKLNFTIKDMQLFLSEDFNIWHRELNNFNIKNLKDINDLNMILNQDKVRLKEFSSYLRKKRLKIVAILAVVIALPLLFIYLTGYMNDR